MNGDRLVSAEARIVAHAPGRVTVETQRLHACTSCGAAHRCGTAALQRIIGQPDNRLTLDTGGSFALGETVTLTTPESGLILAALIAYLLPLAGLFAAVLLAVAAGGPETVLILAAGIGLAAGFVAARWLAAAPGFVARLVPLRIAAKGSGGSCAPR